MSNGTITVRTWDGSRRAPGPEIEVEVALIRNIERQTLVDRSLEDVDGYVIYYTTNGRTLCVGEPPDQDDLLHATTPMDPVATREEATTAETTEDDLEWLEGQASSQETPPPDHTPDLGSPDSFGLSQ